MTMTKRELVIRVANKLQLTQSEVAKVVETTFEAISQALAEGKRWELRDFGVFEVKTRASRIGRNPRTGDQVPVPERRVVTFRPGKKMKEAVTAGPKQPPETPAQEPPRQAAPAAPGSPSPSPPSNPDSSSSPPSSQF